jgi:hypothetical protein
MFNLNLTTRFLSILTGYFVYGSARSTAITIQSKILNMFPLGQYDETKGEVELMTGEYKNETDYSFNSVHRY